MAERQVKKHADNADGARSPIEQVVVQASESLHYDVAMKVVGICLEEKVPHSGDFVKLSLVAMADGR